MQIRCRNCGAALEIPKYHGAMLVTCRTCEWQETLPARRHLSKSLDHRAGDAFTARAERITAVRELLGQVSSLSQRRFEQFCASMFAAKGYEIAFADRMFDESHSIELRSGNETVFVACKPGEHRITVEDLERLAGSMRHDDIAHAIYVTTGTFDEACGELADETGIELIDEDALVERLTDVPIEQLHEWIDPSAIAPTD